MMESSNLNLDLQHQEGLHTSPSLAAQSFHFIGRNHDWNHNLLLNSGEFIPHSNGVLSSSKDFRLSHEIPMVQDIGFQWDGNGDGYNMNHSSSQQSHLSKNIKEELSDSFNPKLSDLNILCRDPSNLQDYSLMPSHLKNGLDQINAIQTTPGAGDLGFGPASMGNFGRESFSMVLPTANISDSSQSLSLYPSSFGMDLQALDLLASTRFGRTLSQPSIENIALLREADLAFGHGHFQDQAQVSSKISPSVSGVTESKRAGSSFESKTSQLAAKKPRFETRSSFTPFKVRKEKLGDRIAALQQLVAPFGKTDTASVLMEAIGYIKFLQDQVETLSVPYMRSSSNRKLRTSQAGASNEDRDEPKPDLRSRGLCLVPLSCTSYVTNENGVWSLPNYRGGS